MTRAAVKHEGPAAPGGRKVLALLTCNASLRDDYQGALRLGMERACAAEDVDLWVFAGRNNWIRSADQHRLFRLLDPTRVQGIVLAAGLIESFTPLAGVLETLRDRCVVPMCSVGQVVPGLPSFLIDNAAAAAQTARHLIQVHGCRRFAYISGPKDHHESRERLRGVQEALAAHGLTLDEHCIATGDFAVSGGRRAVAELLERGRDFDALLAVNDHMALGAIEALRDSRRSCPERVAIAGFDDAASARFGVVPLTTIRQPVQRLGALAVECIVRAWRGEPSAPVTMLGTELILRESCGCRAAGLMVSPLPDAVSAETHEELAAALAPVIEDSTRRQHWAGALQQAVEEEHRGHAGALEGAFAALVHDAGGSQVPLHELQRAVSVLWRNTKQDGSSTLEGAFHAARIRIGAMMYQRAGEQNLRDDQLVDELRLSCERLATSLERPVLEQAMAAELPRLGIRNGFIAAYRANAPEQLEPLLWLKEGAAQALPVKHYPAHLLLPDEVLGHAQRISLTILPLTVESEQLGIAALELPLGSEAYALLREQIGSCIKAAQIHEAMRVQERLHAQSREQQRVTAERLRSLSLIAGGVAHDLNNALGPLVALPEAIVATLSRTDAPAGLQVPHDVLEDLETIRQAGLRAAHTIQDLFLLGRTDQVAKRRIDLSRLLRSEGENLRRLCDRPGLELELQTSNQPLVIQASGPHLLRVISNLVLNAADSIEGSGKIQIRVRSERLQTGRDGIERIEPGTYAVLEVTDTGSGIPPEHLPRILEPFFTTKRRAEQAGAAERSGTGLGLAIVQRIVKDALGFIDIQSRLGEGTTFSLFFPREPEPVISPSHPQLGAPRGHERILVVDDEAVQLRTAQRLLQHLGYAVETAQSGERAIELCASSGGNGFDLLIVDMVMPGGMDGLATVARIRHTQASQKVLIASGYAPDHLNDAARQRGLPWLAKPYTLSGLASAVRSTLAGSIEGTQLDHPGE
jgi:DNA-binding LacI/PurR family transcriptional regulator/signal transduction histidine kinase/ActR/RegA family two-component response regulator